MPLKLSKIFILIYLHLRYRHGSVFWPTPDPHPCLYTSKNTLCFQSKKLIYSLRNPDPDQHTQINPDPTVSKSTSRLIFFLFQDVSEKAKSKNHQNDKEDHLT